MKIERFHDFLKQMAHLRASMVPNNEYAAPLIDMSKLESLDMVDLSQVPDKTIVLAAGCEYANLGFTMRVDVTSNGRIVQVWNDPKSNGLMGSLECIASYTRPNWKFEINGDIMEYEQGVIRKGSQFIMPYFDYCLREGRKSVVSNWRDWHDAWGGVLVQYPSIDHVDIIRNANTFDDVCRDLVQRSIHLSGEQFLFPKFKKLYDQDVHVREEVNSHLENLGVPANIVKEYFTIPEQQPGLFLAFQYGKQIPAETRMKFIESANKLMFNQIKKSLGL